MITCSGLAGGALACSTLAALKQPIILLLKLQPAVLHDANPYWWIRVAITPLVLLNMTLSGILQVSNIPPRPQHSHSKWVHHLYCMASFTAPSF